MRRKCLNCGKKREVRMATIKDGKIELCSCFECMPKFAETILEADIIMKEIID